MAVSMVARRESAGPDEFRISFVKSYLDTVLQVGFVPFDLVHEDPEVPAETLYRFRDQLIGDLIRAVRRDDVATGIVCEAAAGLDHGKSWVDLGEDWLDERFATDLGCERGGTAKF